MREYNGILNISEPTNDYSIYILYSSDNTDNSIYIGVTLDYKQRCYKHSSCRHNKGYFEKPLYKWLIDVIEIQERKVIFEVIEKNYCEIEAFKREIELIHEYKQKGYKVLNLSNGGKGHSGYKPWNKGKELSKELKEQLSKSHLGKCGKQKGHKTSDYTKDKIKEANKKRRENGWVSPLRKKVYKYDLNKSLIKVYSSLQEASINEGVAPNTIINWCIGKIPKRNNFIWSFNKI